MTKRTVLRNLAILMLPALVEAGSGSSLESQVAGELATRIEAENPLEKPARLTVQSLQLGAALTELAERSGVTLVYSPSKLPHYEVSCECYSVPVKAALDNLLAKGHLRYSVHGPNIVIVPRERLGHPFGGEPVARLAGGFAGPGVERGIPSSFTALAADDSERGSRFDVERVGTITGRVTDSRTAQPLASAQVSLPDLGLGTLTQQNGRFVLTNVPAGTHNLLIQRIGYRAATEAVSVVDGASVNRDVALEEEALALDEIIVTGTPGGTQRRAIGNAVGRVEAATITEVAPIQTMQELLGAREPGLNFVRGSGIVGVGSTIRIRGLSSLALNSQPLIYVDGIRVDNTASAGPDLRDAAQVSTLDDFAPGEIESIEIIKGPAAATLYGTEASAGVIQIITKKGESGAPQFDLGVTLGTNWLANVNHWVGTAYDRSNPDAPGLRLYEKEKAEGREWFQYGPLQTYNGSMRGGTDRVRYFLSGEYQDNEGIVHYNWKKQTNLRGNITVLPSDDITLDVNVGYLEGTTSFMQQKNPFGIWDGLIWANAAGVDTRIRGFQRARPEMIEQLEATRDVSRFTGSMTLTHRPTDWLTSRFVVGTDRTDEFNSSLVPRFPEGASTEFGSLGLGDLQISNPVRQTFSIDYGSSVNYGLGPAVNLTSSVGVQYHQRSEHIASAHGQIFPAPQIRTIGGATLKSADETYVENKSLGGYIQQELAWYDRVFLTAALRGDDNSAFGAEFDAAIYPKFSATWVVSDENFWPSLAGGFVNSLRLRTAWGKAGRQPDTFAAVTLFEGAIGPDGNPAISTDVLGNPDLGPEVSTELEVGFDAALFDDRASLEFTYYTQKVEDALMPVPVNPTTGFSGSQSMNAGQLSNWGWELASNVRLLNTDNFAWDIGTTFSMNDNRVDDLGGLTPTNNLREGRPFPLFTRRQVVEVQYTTEDGESGTWPHDIPDPEARVATITSALCDGGAGFDGYSPGGEPVPCAIAPQLQLGNGRVTPKHEGTISTTFTIGQNLRLYAMAEWRGEHWASSIGLSCRYTCGSGRELNTFRPAKWVEGLVGLDGIATGTVGVNSPNTAFAYLREVSANYTVPSSWLEGLGAERASINVAMRNPWLFWQANRFIYNVPVEPEGRDGAGPTNGGDALAQNRLALPSLTSFTVSMRVSF